MSAILLGIWLAPTSARAADRDQRPELGISTGPLHLIGAPKDVLEPSGGVRVNGGLRIENGGNFTRYGLSCDLFMESGLSYLMQGELIVPGDLSVLRLAPQVGLGHAWSAATVSGRLEAGVQRWNAPMNEEYWGDILSDLGADTPLSETGLWVGAGLDAGLVTGKGGVSVGLSLDVDWFVGGALAGLAWSPRLGVNLPL